MMATVLSRIGNALPRGARRLILDRLGGARVAEWVGHGAFVEARLTDGVTIWANPLYHDGMLRAGRVAYEDNFTALLADRVTPGAVFYDIGANIGVFSFLAALEAGPDGVVVAFEPEPNNLVCLRRSLGGGWAGADRAAPVTLIEAAVTAADGEVTFDRRGGAFSGRVAEDGAAAGGTITVPARSLDSLVAAGEIPPPALIKIDVEGGEGGVLEGARDVLAAHRPELMVEMHHFAPEGVARAYAVLDALGYRLLDADGFAEGADAAALPSIPPEARGKVRHVLALPG